MQPIYALFRISSFNNNISIISRDRRKPISIVSRATYLFFYSANCDCFLITFTFRLRAFVATFKCHLVTFLLLERALIPPSCQILCSTKPIYTHAGKRHDLDPYREHFPDYQEIPLFRP